VKVKTGEFELKKKLGGVTREGRGGGRERRIRNRGRS
jgi:hypothetical protein